MGSGHGEKERIRNRFFRAEIWQKTHCVSIPNPDSMLYGSECGGLEAREADYRPPAGERILSIAARK